MLGFQAGVSYSAEETKKKLMEAFEDPASKFKGAAGELAKTWGGMLSMMSDAWFQFRNMVMEAGIFDYIRGALSLLLAHIRELREQGDLGSWAKDMADKVVGALGTIAKWVARLSDAWWGWKMIWEGLKLGFASFSMIINTGLEVLADSIEAIFRLLGAAIGKMGRLIEIMDITGMFVGLGKSMQAVGAQLEGMTEASKKFGESAAYWKNIADEADKTLASLTGQESNYEKVLHLLEKVKTKAAEYAAEADKAGIDRPVLKKPKEADVKGARSIQKSESNRLAVISNAEMANLDRIYEYGLIKMTEYYDTKKEMISAQFEHEMEILRAGAAEEKDPIKKLAIEDQLFAKRSAYHQALADIELDIWNAEKERNKERISAVKLIEDIKARVKISTGTGLDSLFQKEKAELQERHNDEIQSLKDMKAEQALIEEAYRMQQIERDQLAVDQRKKALDTHLANTKSAMAFMADAFGAMYESTGRQSKKWARAQRAMQVGLTIITTYQSAVDAYAAGMKIPVVGYILAPIMAAFAVAAGMAKVSAMRSQQLALGGEVKGRSPHTKADNIPIDATAGEFMQPVSAVQYYGKSVMEAMRRKMIPSEIFAGWRDRSFVVPKGRSLATGGAPDIVPTTSQPAASTMVPLTIINVTDPREIQKWVSSPEGQDAYLNVISSNAGIVRRLLEIER